MQISRSDHSKALSVFSLVMLNVIAVDSLRTLPISAAYGYSLIFYYVLAGLFFFIPTALITAELATAWPATGGAYIWIREAFGARYGFLAIWLQWIYNVVWYPTILSFIAATLAYLVDPQLANNKIFLLSTILIIFWGTTLINYLGIGVSNLVSSIGTIFGTMIPMLFIIGLGISWLYHGHKTQTPFSIKELFPNLDSINNLSLLVAVLFGLMGLEMSAVHAGDVKNPGRDYPKALLISVLLIIFSLMLASLAIVVVVPASELNLITGLIDAYKAFFTAYHMTWCMPLIIIAIVIGALSCISAWVLGPARGLMVAAEDDLLHMHFKTKNKYGAPTSILFAQAILMTIISIVFMCIPTVSGAYWVLTDLTSQLALLFYIMLFAAAIALRFKKPYIARPYKIPGGKYGMCLVAGTAIFSCAIAISLGFIPPAQVKVGDTVIFESILVGGILLLCLPALCINYYTRGKRVTH